MESEVAAPLQQTQANLDVRGVVGSLWCAGRLISETHCGGCHAPGALQTIDVPTSAPQHHCQGPLLLSTAAVHSSHSLPEEGSLPGPLRVVDSLQPGLGAPGNWASSQCIPLLQHSSQPQTRLLT